MQCSCCFHSVDHIFTKSLLCSDLEVHARDIGSGEDRDFVKHHGERCIWLDNHMGQVPFAEGSSHEMSSEAHSGHIEMLLSLSIGEVGVS